MMKNPSRTLIGLALGLLVIVFCANLLPFPSSHGEENALTIELVIDVPGLSSVFYTAYLDGNRACSGGAADLDGEILEEGRVLEYTIPMFLLGDDVDLSGFSIDFSPYDQESVYELWRTEQVAFPAEPGQAYRFHLIQLDDGYAAIPEEEEDIGKESIEQFIIEIGGNVMPEEVDFS